MSRPVKPRIRLPSHTVSSCQGSWLVCFLGVRPEGLWATLATPAHRGSQQGSAASLAHFQLSLEHPHCGVSTPDPRSLGLRSYSTSVSQALLGPTVVPFLTSLRLGSSLYWCPLSSQGLVCTAQKEGLWSLSPEHPTPCTLLPETATKKSMPLGRKQLQVTETSKFEALVLYLQKE